MVIGYVNGMEIYYRALCGKGAPLGGYFVTRFSGGRYEVIVPDPAELLRRRSEY